VAAKTWPCGWKEEGYAPILAAAGLEGEIGDEAPEAVASAEPAMRAAR